MYGIPVYKNGYILVQELDRLRIVLMQAKPSCVSRRLLGCLEYTIASTIGLHHGNTAVLALGDPYVVARTWSGVVSNVIYDIGLIMSLVHQDTASSTGPFRVYDSLNRRSPKPCQSSRDSV